MYLKHLYSDIKKQIDNFYLLDYVKYKKILKQKT